MANPTQHASTTVSDLSLVGAAVLISEYHIVSNSHDRARTILEPLRKLTAACKSLPHNLHRVITLSLFLCYVHCGQYRHAIQFVLASLRLSRVVIQTLNGLLLAWCTKCSFRTLKSICQELLLHESINILHDNHRDSRARCTTGRTQIDNRQRCSTSDGRQENETTTIAHTAALNVLMSGDWRRIDHTGAESENSYCFACSRQPLRRKTTRSLSYGVGDPKMRTKRELFSVQLNHQQPRIWRGSLNSLDLSGLFLSQFLIV